MKTRHNQISHHQAKPKIKTKQEPNAKNSNKRLIKKAASEITANSSNEQALPQHGYNFRQKRNRTPGLFSQLPRPAPIAVPAEPLAALPIPAASNLEAIDELAVLSTQLSKLNVNELMLRVKSLQAKASQAMNDPNSKFSFKIAAILLSYFSNTTNYQSPFNQVNDCIYDILKSDRPYLRQKIIDTLLDFILQNPAALKDYTNQTDLSLYKAFKILFDCQFYAARESDTDYPAKLIVRLLIARNKQLENIMASLFSLNTGAKLKSLVYLSLLKSMENNDNHTNKLPFTANQLTTAFHKWSEITARNNLCIEAEKEGSGTYGVVYKANERDQPSNVFAVKFNKDIETVFQSKHGISFLRQANHPNIVHFKYVIEIGEKSGVVMEYANYGNLANYMRDTYQPNVRFPVLAMHIIQGLAYIHQSGFTHNDVKPWNVLVFAIGDLRIAKITDVDTFKPIGSKRKQNLSTLQYSSPEDHTIGTSFQPSSDIYSFGSVLFYMKTFKSPHDELADKPKGKDEIIGQITQGVTETLENYPMPESISNLIKWCWKRHPDERPTHEQITTCLNELTQPSLKK